MKSFFLKGCLAFVLIQSQMVQAAQTTKPAITNGKLQMTEQTTLTQIRNAPAKTQIVLPNGKTVTARQYTKLADAIVKIRKLSLQPPIQGQNSFSRTNAPATIKLDRGSNLQEIAKRSDSDVIELPDGQKLTVKDLRQLSVLQQKLRGKSLLAITPVKRPSRVGAAVKVYTIDDIKKLEGQPDATILETADGKRITLGELKAFAKARGKNLGDIK